MKEIYVDCLLPCGSGSGTEDDPWSADMLSFDTTVGARIFFKDHDGTIPIPVIESTFKYKWREHWWQFWRMKNLIFHGYESVPGHTDE